MDSLLKSASYASHRKAGLCGELMKTLDVVDETDVAVVIFGYFDDLGFVATDKRRCCCQVDIDGLLLPLKKFLEPESGFNTAGWSTKVTVCSSRNADVNRTS